MKTKLYRFSLVFLSLMSHFFSFPDISLNLSEFTEISCFHLVGTSSHISLLVQLACSQGPNPQNTIKMFSGPIFAGQLPQLTEKLPQLALELWQLADILSGLVLGDKK